MSESIDWVASGASPFFFASVQVGLEREHGLTHLFISHSMPLVRYLSTRIAVMERGRLVEIGEAEAICSAPQMPYTQRLLAATPELPATSAAAE